APLIAVSTLAHWWWVVSCPVFAVPYVQPGHSCPRCFSPTTADPSGFPVLLAVAPGFACGQSSVVLHKRCKPRSRRSRPPRQATPRGPAVRPSCHFLRTAQHRTAAAHIDLQLRVTSPPGLAQRLQLQRRFTAERQTTAPLGSQAGVIADKAFHQPVFQ